MFFRIRKGAFGRCQSPTKHKKVRNEVLVWIYLLAGNIKAGTLKKALEKRYRTYTRILQIELTRESY